MGDRTRASGRAATDVLRNVTLFRGCNDASLQRVSALAPEQEFAAGALLASETNVQPRFYVITVGLATVSVLGKPVATMGPGDFFGESTLLLREPRSPTVLAKTALRALVFEPGPFAELLASVPEVTGEMLRRKEIVIASSPDAPLPARGAPGGRASAS